MREGSAVRQSPEKKEVTPPNWEPAVLWQDKTCWEQPPNVPDPDRELRELRELLQAHGERLSLPGQPHGPTEVAVVGLNVPPEHSPRPPRFLSVQGFPAWSERSDASTSGGRGGGIISSASALRSLSRLSTRSHLDDGLNSFGGNLPVSHVHGGGDNKWLWLEEASIVLGNATLSAMEQLQKFADSKFEKVFDFEEDKEKLKQQVRRNLLSKEVYQVESLYSKTGICQAIARELWFEKVAMIVIAANALYLALDTDYNRSQSLIEASLAFRVAENFFCAFFTVEWLIRFMAFERKADFTKDNWMLLDGLLAALMVVQTWVFSIFFLVARTYATRALATPTILRLLRLVRLVKLVKMMHSRPEMIMLVYGMLRALKAVLYVMTLLIVVVYMFSIALADLSQGTVFKELYFQTVPLSMLNLATHALLLDNLAQFCNDVRAESPLCLFLVVACLVFGNLTFLNMLVGILYRVVKGVADTERERVMTLAVKQKMHNIVKTLDTDESGLIAYEEFCQIMDIPQALRCLEEVGVDPEGVVDFAEQFFWEDGKPIELPFPKFMEMVLDLRGSNAVTLRDVKAFFLQVTPKLNKMAKDVTRIQEEIQARTRYLEIRIATVLIEVQTAAEQIHRLQRGVRSERRHGTR